MKLFDAGLQPERSELAWRRTSLTVGLGAVVSVRLLPALLGDASWALVGVGGMGLSTILWVASRVRHRRINAVLHRDGSYAALPGAALLGALAVFASFVGLAALALVVALSVGVGRGS